MAKNSKNRSSDPKDRLFIGVYPGGLVYADRYVEEHGDYRRLGFLSYRTLELELSKKVPKAVLPLIEASADAMKAKKGQFFQISASNQGVILGE